MGGSRPKDDHRLQGSDISARRSRNRRLSGSYQGHEISVVACHSITPWVAVRQRLLVRLFAIFVRHVVERGNGCHGRRASQDQGSRPHRHSIVTLGCAVRTLVRTCRTLATAWRSVGASQTETLLVGDKQLLEMEASGNSLPAIVEAPCNLVFNFGTEPATLILAAGP